MSDGGPRRDILQKTTTWNRTVPSLFFHTSSKNECCSAGLRLRKSPSPLSWSASESKVPSIWRLPQLVNWSRIFTTARAANCADFCASTMDGIVVWIQETSTWNFNDQLINQPNTQSIDQWTSLPQNQSINRSVISQINPSFHLNQ